MLYRKLLIGGLALFMVSVFSVGMLAAREGDGDRRRGPKGERGHRGDGGDFNQAEMKERMLGRTRESLDVSDEAWADIAPKLKTVMELKRDAHPGGPGQKHMRRGGGRGDGESRGKRGGREGREGRRHHEREGDFDGPPRHGEFDKGKGPGKNRQKSEVRKAQKTLRKSLRDENATDEEVANSLAAFRKARTDARAKLKAAENDLKAQLDLRGEAKMVAMGILP